MLGNVVLNVLGLKVDERFALILCSLKDLKNGECTREDSAPGRIRVVSVGAEAGGDALHPEFEQLLLRPLLAKILGQGKRTLQRPRGHPCTSPLVDQRVPGIRGSYSLHEYPNGITSHQGRHTSIYIYT